MRMAFRVILTQLIAVIYDSHVREYSFLGFNIVEDSIFGNGILMKCVAFGMGQLN